MTQATNINPVVDTGTLRQAIQHEYQAVAENPGQGFHFHTGRPLTNILGYAEEWLENVPERSIESFAGTGNPFSLGQIEPAEKVLDLGWTPLPEVPALEISAQMRFSFRLLSAIIDNC